MRSDFWSLAACRVAASTIFEFVFTGYVYRSDTKAAGGRGGGFLRRLPCLTKRTIS